MNHIYDCKHRNKKEPVIKYEQLYSEELFNQKIVLKILNREEILEQRREIHNCDPLYCYSIALEKNIYAQIQMFAIHIRPNFQGY